MPFFVPCSLQVVEKFNKFEKQRQELIRGNVQMFVPK